MVRGMSFGAISGILSAHTLLLAKSAVELLVRTIVDKVNQFNQWQSWMILLGLVFLALTQLYYLNRGLKLVSTSILYPFVFCVYNVIAILDGLIYFDQGSRLPTRDALLLAVGTAVLLGGVFALSWRLQADDDLPGPAAVDIKAKSRVVAPRPILQPGMGIEPHSTDLSDEEVPFVRPGDDEEALRGASHLHHPSVSDNENTPLLLRTKTGPMRSQGDEWRSETFKPPKPRRMTTIQDDTAIDLWDELNDRPGTGNKRYGTLNDGPKSPITPRSARRSVSGPRKSRTLSLNQRGRIGSIGDLAQMPFRYFSSSMSGSASASRENIASPPPMESEPETDGEDGDHEHEEAEGSGRGRRHTTGLEERPNWVKLQKWWKKRWREG